MNKVKLVSIAVTPMVTASLSSVASLAIIISILRSEVKLSTSYRRLVFGISIYDLLQSLSQVFSSVPMPAGTFLFASGNNISCNLQAFFCTIGFTGTILYSLSLTVYFLLIVRYDAADEKVKKYAEPILHGVPIMYSGILSIYCLVTSNYGPSGVICWINSTPPNCYEDPGVDCISRGNPETLRWISGGPIFVIFVLNCIMMVMIWWHVSQQTKKSQAYRYSWMLSSPTSNNQHLSGQQGTTDEANIDSNTWRSRCSNLFSDILSCFSPRKNQEAADQVYSSPLAARLARPSQASIRRMKETSNRAVAYIVGFILTYFFSALYRIIELNSSSPVPFTIIILSRFFYPLQG